MVRRHPETGERRLDFLTWGFLAHWAKDPKVVHRPINARSETAATAPMFRDALAHRRCLVPADAFYEWQQRDGREPFAVARTDRCPMALARLWDGWCEPGRLLRPAEEDALRAWRVGRRVNSVASNDASLLDPAGQERLP